MNEKWLRTGRKLLDSTCPNWNTYPPGTPQPYMIPSMFRHERKGPFYFPGEGCVSSGGTILSDSTGVSGNVRGCDAEAVVYSSIEKLQQSTDAPFLCFRSFKVTAGVISELRCHFPDFIVPARQEFSKAQMTGKVKRNDGGECDLLCLSPKFGVVLIEVKANDTRSSPKSFTDACDKAFTQLTYYKDFLQSTMGCFGINSQPISLLTVFPFTNLSFEHRQLLQSRGVTVLDQDCLLEMIDLFGTLTQRTDYNVTMSSFEKLSCIIAKMYEIAAPRVAAVQSVYRKPSGVVIKEERRHASASNFFATKKTKRSKGMQTFGIKMLGASAGLLAPANDTLQTNCSRQVKLAVGRSLGDVYLTPEQYVAWKGPSHQFIQGVEGTGKTFLLLGKVFRSFHRGGLQSAVPDDAMLRITVCTIQRCTAIYERLCMVASEYLPILFSVMSFDNVTTKFPGAFDQIGKAFNENGGCEHQPNTFNNVVGDLLKRQLSVENAENHVLVIDDLDADARPQIHAFAALTIRQNLFSSAWIAGQPGSLVASWLEKEVMESGQNVKLFRSPLKKLSTINRNGRNVYHAYNRLSFCGRNGVYPQTHSKGLCGHRLMGSTAKHISIADTGDNMLALWNSVKVQLDKLLYYPDCYLDKTAVLTLSDVAILMSVDVGIQLITELRGLMDDNFCPSGSIYDQAKSEEPRLAVDSVRNSHSFEWPVVMFVHRTAVDDSEARLAMTRCVVALVDIELVNKQTS